MPSIRQRGDSFQIIVANGKDAEGKRKTEVLTIKRNPNMSDKNWEKELQKIAIDFETKVKNGEIFDGSRITISEFIDIWLKKRQKTLANRSYEGYKSLLDGRVKYALGHLKLTDIKPLHLLNFYDNLQEPGMRDNNLFIANSNFIDYLTQNKLNINDAAKILSITTQTMSRILNGKNTNIAKKICSKLKLNINKYFTPAGINSNLSINTIHHYHKAISAMFSDAVSWGIIADTPCRKGKIKLPKLEEKEKQILDDDGIESLFESLETEDIKTQTLITLSLMAGCRRSEIIALQWDCINFDNNTITIKQAATYTKDTGIVVGPTKNKTQRTISIDKDTMKLLKKYKKWQSEHKIKIANLWQEEARIEAEKNRLEFIDPEWVFTTWNGYIMHPDSYTKIFRKFREYNGLPKVRLHDLRHTSVSMLIDAGLSIKEVAARHGHGPEVALKIYTHRVKASDIKAAEIMGNLKKRSKTSTPKAK